MNSKQFDFASGNCRKLLAAPKYLLAAVFSLFVPRSEKLWAFGSGIGVGEGALAVARALREEHSGARIVWLVANETEAESARQEQFEPVLRRGWNGYWATLRAGQLIVTHGAGDLNRFGVFGGYLVNLIHGAPIKRLHLDSSVTTRVSGPAPVRMLLRQMYRMGASQVDMFVAGSPTAAERLRSAYRLPHGRVKVLGDPRDDVLCEQRTDLNRLAAARAEVCTVLGEEFEVSDQTPLVLYAPTWRDGDPDPAVPTAQEIVEIRSELERINGFLVIRSHPHGAGAYEPAVSDRVCLLNSSQIREITPFLGAFDAVITDYSSIAVDFALLKRPIVWFAPDLAHYSATRGLYEPFEVTAAGRVQSTWAQTLARLNEVFSDPEQFHIAQTEAGSLAERFHAFPEGGAASRVLEEVRRSRVSGPKGRSA